MTHNVLRKILRQHLVQKIVRESMLQNYTRKTSKLLHAFESKILPSIFKIQLEYTYMAIYSRFF